MILFNLLFIFFSKEEMADIFLQNLITEEIWLQNLMEYLFILYNT